MPAAKRRADTGGERAVPDRDEDGRGGNGALLQDLAPDRPVGVVLERLRAVLEESEPCLVGVCARGVLGVVEVVPGDVDVCTQTLEVGELCVRAAWGHEDDPADPDLSARPGDGGAVVAGRSRDDRVVPVPGELLDDREGATPLEHAELVVVFPLQPDVVAADVLGQARRCGIERSQCRRSELAANRFDVVPVGVEQEGGVVAPAGLGAVLLAHPRGTVVPTAGREAGTVERLDLLTRVGDERDVHRAARIGLAVRDDEVR